MPGPRQLRYLLSRASVNVVENATLLVPMRNILDAHLSTIWLTIYEASPGFGLPDSSLVEAEMTAGPTFLPRES